MKKVFIVALLFLGFQKLNASDGVLVYALKQGLSQGALLLKAQNIKKRLKDPLLPASYKRSLQLAVEIMDFAKEIHLNTKNSYQNFVELDRDWVTQVVVAAEKDRFKLVDFKFPIAGSFPYKGFFDEEEARAFEKELSKKYDVYRRKVPAFSSLGWFSDPVTSNLFARDADLIETLFHELVHLNFYFDEEADFNEAFATWFSYYASQDFSKKAKNINNREQLQKELQESRVFDEELSAFLSEVLRAGERFYSKKPSTAERERFFSAIPKCIEHFPRLKGLGAVRWNNAALLSFSTYMKFIPKIEEYSKKHNLAYKAFFDEVLREGPSIVKKIYSEYDQVKRNEAVSLCRSFDNL